MIRVTLTDDDESINERLQRGEYVRVGNRLYARCGRCRGVIRVDKPLFGDLHICE